MLKVEVRVVHKHRFTRALYEHFLCKEIWWMLTLCGVYP